MPNKPYPADWYFCPDCGAKKRPLVSCCRPCFVIRQRALRKGVPRSADVRERIKASVPRGTRHHAWKATAAGAQSGRSRAQVLYVESQPCAICGVSPTERHHKDGNTLNNATANVVFLCKRHHHQIHPGNGHMPLRDYDVMAAYLARWKYSPWRYMKRRYAFIARQLTPTLVRAAA